MEAKMFEQKQKQNSWSDRPTCDIAIIFVQGAMSEIDVYIYDSTMGTTPGDMLKVRKECKSLHQN